MMEPEIVQQKSWHAWGMAFLARYERHLSASAFVVGFVLDNLFTPQIEDIGTPLLMGGYLSLVAVLIVVLQRAESAEVKGKGHERIMRLFPIAIQLVFGALMSVLFVYYSRSASLAGSWPFMLLLGIIFVGNELFRDRFKRLEFQLGVFFFALLMATVVYFPVLFRTLGVIPFLAATVASVAAIIALMWLLSALGSETMKRKFFSTLAIMFVIAGTVNALYFARLIPPIPLSLRAAGVYHFVAKDEAGNYRVQGEKASWKESVGIVPSAFHLAPGEQTYFYTAVFAPTAIAVPIVHEWQYKDIRTEKWTPSMRITFPIIGGRDEGYRGYSVKENISEGLWRVLVKTENGALLGRETFRIISVPAPVPVEKKTL